MALFKKREDDVNIPEEESFGDLTLFAMAGEEPTMVEKDKSDGSTGEYKWMEEFSKLEKDEREELVYFKDQLSNHFIKHNNPYYLKKDKLDEKREDALKQDFLNRVDVQVAEKGIPEKYVKILKEFLCRSISSYYMLDPLIENENIQDIHVYGYNDVCVLLRDGLRYKTDVEFLSKKDYQDFISRVKIRNGQGQSDGDAIVKFTDNESSPDFKLRFDILTEFVTSGTGQPYLHIRKHPKNKYTVKDLYKFGAFRDEDVRDFVIESVKNGDSMLFTGKNNSAKTTMLNALIDEIDEQKNIFIIEDNEELFSDKRGGIVYVHSVENKKEGKITYTLSELAEVSLLCDVDVVIVGEVKNDSAKGLMKAAYVGAQCFSTSHGQSAIDGYYKLADYVKQATEYSLDDCLRFLAGFKTLVYMEKKRISEIVVVDRLDKKRMPVFKEIYNIKKGGWIKDEQNN